MEQAYVYLNPILNTVVEKTSEKAMKYLSKGFKQHQKTEPPPVEIKTNKMKIFIELTPTLFMIVLLVITKKHVWINILIIFLNFLVILYNCVPRIKVFFDMIWEKTNSS